ncbi:hypothetical protein [Caballeronia sp. KNU42]
MASLAGAIASFSAAFAAIWIGLDAIRYRARVEKVRARVTAVSLLPIIQQMRFHARILERSLRSVHEKLQGPGVRDDNYENNLRTSMKGLFEKYTLDQLTQLAPISPVGAEALAEAHSLITLLHQDIVVEGLDKLSERTGESAYSPRQKQCLTWVASVRRCLSDGEAECKKIK